MQAITIDGPAEYFRVLFPMLTTQSGHAVFVDLDEAAVEMIRSHEIRLAQEVTATLWENRERHRRHARDLGRVRLQIQHDVLGDVSAAACLECRWVSWVGGLALPEHPSGCLIVPQTPDDGTAMRVSPCGADLQAEGWGPYFDTLAPRRLMGDTYGYVGRINHHARRAKAAWAQREATRHAAGETEVSWHRGVVLELPTDVLVGCTSCFWLTKLSGMETPAWRTQDVSLDDLFMPGWRSAATMLAAQHERDMGC